MNNIAIDYNIDIDLLILKRDAYETENFNFFATISRHL